MEDWMQKAQESENGRDIVWNLQVLRQDAAVAAQWPGKIDALLAEGSLQAALLAEQAKVGYAGACEGFLKDSQKLHGDMSLGVFGGMGEKAGFSLYGGFMSPEELAIQKRIKELAAGQGVVYHLPDEGFLVTYTLEAQAKLRECEKRARAEAAGKPYVPGKPESWIMDFKEMAAGAGVSADEALGFDMNGGFMSPKELAIQKRIKELAASKGVVYHLPDSGFLVSYTPEAQAKIRECDKRARAEAAGKPYVPSEPESWILKASSLASSTLDSLPKAHLPKEVSNSLGEWADKFKALGISADSLSKDEKSEPRLPGIGAVGDKLRARSNAAEGALPAKTKGLSSSA